jgi:hypothetical protein
LAAYESLFVISVFIEVRMAVSLFVRTYMPYLTEILQVVLELKQADIPTAGYTAFLAVYILLTSRKECLNNQWFVVRFCSNERHERCLSCSLTLRARSFSFHFLSVTQTVIFQSSHKSSLDFPKLPLRLLCMSVFRLHATHRCLRSCCEGTATRISP